MYSSSSVTQIISVLVCRLFITLFEYMIKKIDWEQMSINIVEEKLNHLRFADDIVLFTDRVNEAKEMLAKLSHVSNQVGLKFNIDKTKCMTNLVLSEKITLDDMEVEQVVMYKYYVQIRLGRDNQTCEIFRRMRLAWCSELTSLFALREKFSINAYSLS